MKKIHRHLFLLALLHFMPLSGLAQSIGTVIGIDCGPFPAPHWNTFGSAGTITPGTVVDLNDEVVEGVGISFEGSTFNSDGTDSWRAANERPLPDVPDAATTDIALSAPSVGLTITGLDTKLAYDLSVVTASNRALNRIDAVTITGEKYALTSRILRAHSAEGGYHLFRGVVPREGGVLTINVTDASGNRNPILNAIRLEAVALDGQQPSVLQPGVPESATGAPEATDVTEVVAEDEAEDFEGRLPEDRLDQFRSLLSPDNLFDVPPRVFSGENLTAVDIPVGAVGGGVVRMNGQAQRHWWHIFNNHEQRPDTGKVPNSFFAIRTKSGGDTQVRALQTAAEGPFRAMESLTLQSEFPFADYAFEDDALPVSVSLEAYSFLIPADLKHSALPSAIFSYTVENPGTAEVEVSLLATQQNAVGFTGYGAIQGENNREFDGYGSNRNEVVSNSKRTSLNMTGNAGSMVLSAYEAGMSHSATWDSLAALHAEFGATGRLVGPAEASSPREDVTVDGALAKSFILAPGETKTITFVLSWHIPKGTFGREGRQWYFPEVGSQYEHWFADAAAVDSYVFDHFEELDERTRAYRDTLYSSNIPRYVLDRISANASVLKSPTTFWTKDGYFGIWESTSSKQVWFGNVKHVLHYAQTHARLFPELDRILRLQDLNSMLESGLFPARDGVRQNAMDGHFGALLSVYRTHLLSTDEAFLSENWAQAKRAMDFVIETYDADRDGMFSGQYHNTLDCNSSGTSPWIGSLYLAALKASERMARIVGDTASATGYGELFETGRRNQNAQLWNAERGYYTEKAQHLPDTRVMGDAVSIDMFLGQWWANQLDLGQIYPVDRTRQGLRKIYTTNLFTDPGVGYPKRYRDFLGTGDSGWQMFVWPGEAPENTIHYYSEVMTGFEYSMAATLMQYGLVNEGLSVVRTIFDRYDGRLRGQGEVSMAANSTVTGTGSPVGEDECGKFYARSMSSWSTLLALQGFSYDGPRQSIGFQPVWRPEDHASFFTAAKGWGLFTQSRTAKSQQATINLEFGTLDLRTLVLAAPDGRQVTDIRVTLDGQRLPIQSSKQTGNRVEIELKQSASLEAGSFLEIRINL